MSGHGFPGHIAHFQISRYGLIGEIECTRGEGDPCRVFCSESECEEGCIAPDDHEQKPNGSCNIKDWLENDDVFDCYAGDPESIRDGEIRASWTGDNYEWVYAS